MLLVGYARACLRWVWFLLSVLSFLVLPFLIFLLVSSAPLSLLVSLSLSQWKASLLVCTDLVRTSCFQGHCFDGVAFARGIFELYAVGCCLGSSCSCDPLWHLLLLHVGRSGLYAVGCYAILCVRGRSHSSGPLHRGESWALCFRSLSVFIGV